METLKVQVLEMLLSVLFTKILEQPFWTGTQVCCGITAGYVCLCECVCVAFILKSHSK